MIMRWAWTGMFSDAAIWSGSKIFSAAARTYRSRGNISAMEAGEGDTKFELQRGHGEEHDARSYQKLGGGLHYRIWE